MIEVPIVSEREVDDLSPETLHVSGLGVDQTKNRHY